MQYKGNNIMNFSKSETLEILNVFGNVLTRLVDRIENEHEFDPFERRELLNTMYKKLCGIQIEEIMENARKKHKLQLKRGNTDNNDIYTGQPGEITMDMDIKSIRIHDGETVGGTALARASDTVGDWVIEYQNPTADNNYTWYRKYKSGWVEMGGKYTNKGDSAGYRTISLPIPMSDSSYNINTSCYSSYTNGTGSSHAYVMEKGAVVYNQTTNSFQVFCQEDASKSIVYWTVCGI